MPLYELKPIPNITGEKLKILKLHWSATGEVEDLKCEFDSFCKEIRLEGTYLGELAIIQRRLEEIASLKRLPQTKFKNITPKKETVKEYEIKTRNLRVYLIHIEKTGKLIILGGKKSTQKRDIKRFRRIKRDFLAFSKA